MGLVEGSNRAEVVCRSIGVFRAGATRKELRRGGAVRSEANDPNSAAARAYSDRSTYALRQYHPFPSTFVPSAREQPVSCRGCAARTPELARNRTPAET